MNKKKLILKIILAVIGIPVLLYIGYIALILIAFSEPRVGWKEKREVSQFVEDYLTKKYGNQGFKVTKVGYDFEMQYIGDHSHKIGYCIYYKSNTVDKVYGRVSGLSTEKMTMEYDNFLDAYYGDDAFIYKSAKPNLIKKINSQLAEKINKEFDSNVVNIQNTRIELINLDNLGRIPTIDELSNNVDFYRPFEFKLVYTDGHEFDNEDEYKDRMAEYLSNNLYGTWGCYIYPSKTIECDTK